MTVREIENIVRTLCIRHADLDEPMLRILLRAGGWEDSPIRDALSIFARYQKTRSATPVQRLANPSQQENILPTVATSTSSTTVQEKVLVSHSDMLPLSARALLGSSLPKKEDVSLLPEMVGTNRLIEGHQEEASKNEYEESLVLIKEALQNKETQHDTQEVKVVEGVQDTIITQEGVEHIAKPVTSAVVPVANTSTGVLSKQEEEIVYFTQDGHLIEEETPVVLPETVSTDKESSSSLVKQVQRMVVDEKISDTIVLSTDAQRSIVSNSNDPQSLIVHNEPRMAQRIVQQHDSAIPDNLPLRPFESSPHVVPFSKYKETFYKEEAVPVLPVKIEENNNHNVHPPEQVEIRKTPLSKGDESIAILAGIMLLVIMLLLGYMYGNGRL
jgi:hypothetical protein